TPNELKISPAARPLKCDGRKRDLLAGLKREQSGLCPRHDDLRPPDPESPPFAGQRIAGGKPDAPLARGNRLGILQEFRARLPSWRTTTPCHITDMDTGIRMATIMDMIMAMTMRPSRVPMTMA